MHLTLKAEATKPAGFNFLQQRDRFDTFMEVYKKERPHESLTGHYPGDVYIPSVREYRVPDPPEYPYHDRTIVVTRCGHIGYTFRYLEGSTDALE
jgi:putative transposase